MENCSVCNATLPTPPQTGGSGYGLDPQTSAKVCYACCGLRDRESMIKHGDATLYLVRSDNGQWKITNWPASLSFPCGSPRKGRHNIAGSRYDAWFAGPDGFIWHAVNYGENSQIARCRRTKEPSKKPSPQFYTAKGRLTPYALACGYLETKGDLAGLTVSLEQDASVFHVKAYDYASKVRIAWDSFQTLGEARKAYDAYKGLRSPALGSPAPRVYSCALCGQHITDGKPCGCGARP